MPKMPVLRFAPPVPGSPDASRGGWESRDLPAEIPEAQVSQPPLIKSIGMMGLSHVCHFVETPLMPVPLVRLMGEITEQMGHPKVREQVQREKLYQNARKLAQALSVFAMKAAERPAYVITGKEFQESTRKTWEKLKTIAERTNSDEILRMLEEPYKRFEKICLPDKSVIVDHDALESDADENLLDAVHAQSGVKLKAALEKAYHGKIKRQGESRALITLLELLQRPSVPASNRQKALQALSKIDFTQRILEKIRLEWIAAPAMENMGPGAKDAKEKALKILGHEQIFDEGIATLGKYSNRFLTGVLPEAIALDEIKAPPSPRRKQFPLRQALADIRERAPMLAFRLMLLTHMLKQPTLSLEELQLLSKHETRSDLDVVQYLAGLPTEALIAHLKGFYELNPDAKPEASFQSLTRLCALLAKERPEMREILEATLEHVAEETGQIAASIPEAHAGIDEGNASPPPPSATETKPVRKKEPRTKPGIPAEPPENARPEKLLTLAEAREQLETRYQVQMFEDAEADNVPRTAFGHMLQKLLERQHLETTENRRRLWEALYAIGRDMGMDAEILLKVRAMGKLPTPGNQVAPASSAADFRGPEPAPVPETVPTAIQSQPDKPRELYLMPPAPPHLSRRNRTTLTPSETESRVRAALDGQPGVSLAGASEADVYESILTAFGEARKKPRTSPQGAFLALCRQVEDLKGWQPHGTRRRLWQALNTLRRKEFPSKTRFDNARENPGPAQVNAASPAGFRVLAPFVRPATTPPPMPESLTEPAAATSADNPDDKPVDSNVGQLNATNAAEVTSPTEEEPAAGETPVAPALDAAKPPGTPQPAIADPRFRRELKKHRNEERRLPDKPRAARHGQAEPVSNKLEKTPAETPQEPPIFSEIVASDADLLKLGELLETEGYPGIYKALNEAYQYRRKQHPSKAKALANIWYCITDSVANGQVKRLYPVTQKAELLSANIAKAWFQHALEAGFLRGDDIGMKNGIVRLQPEAAAEETVKRFNRKDLRDRLLGMLAAKMRRTEAIV